MSPHDSVVVVLAVLVDSGNTDIALEDVCPLMVFGVISFVYGKRLGYIPQQSCASGAHY